MARSFVLPQTVTDILAEKPRPTLWEEDHAWAGARFQLYTAPRGVQNHTGRAAPVPVPYKSTTRGKPDRDDRPAENPPTKIQVPNYLSSAVSKTQLRGSDVNIQISHSHTTVRPFICTLHPMVLVLSCQAPSELKLPFPPPPSGV